jgi:NAD(P)-dependent dehydrogenase (short-subunit alcohol dehydrogenase family)
MKTAVVTGAGRGLGRLVAKGLAAKGFHVVITDINGVAAEQTAAEIGDRATSMQQDVRDPESHRQVAARAAELGTLSLWVNNAGVLESGLAWEMDETRVRRQIEVNFTGLVWGCHAAIERMKEAGGGHIINIASISSLVPAPGVAVYGATKHAVLGYTYSLKGDLDHAGLPIKVSAVCPDAINTDMVREVEGDEESALLFSASKLLTPEKVSEVVLDVVDHPRLVTITPRHRGALAYAFQPFPAVGLRVLEQFRKLGERNRRKRAANGH